MSQCSYLMGREIPHRGMGCWLIPYLGTKPHGENVLVIKRDRHVENSQEHCQ